MRLQTVLNNEVMYLGTRACRPLANGEKMRKKTRSTRPLAFSLILITLVFANTAALARESVGNDPNAKLEQMTDLIVAMAPVGVEMESFMQKSEYWPWRTAPQNG